MKRLRPSPAMVVACIALLVALGGTSIAAVTQLVPRNSVGTLQLKNNAVTSAKVKNQSLLRADFKCTAGTASANFIKITAIKVANLTNSG